MKATAAAEGPRRRPESLSPRRKRVVREARPMQAVRAGAGAGAAGQANDGPSVSDAKRTIEHGHFSPGAAASGSDGAGAVARLAADTAVYV